MKFKDLFKRIDSVKNSSSYKKYKCMFKINYGF